MTFSRMEAAMEDAFVEWVATERTPRKHENDINFLVIVD